MGPEAPPEGGGPGRLQGSAGPTAALRRSFGARFEIVPVSVARVLPAVQVAEWTLLLPPRRTTAAGAPPLRAEVRIRLANPGEAALSA